MPVQIIRIHGSPHVLTARTICTITRVLSHLSLELSHSMLFMSRNVHERVAVLVDEQTTTRRDFVARIDT